MNKILTILITVLTALNLQAADVDSLFTRWESLTGSRRVRTGNELLELGYRDGIIPEKYTYGRSQAIESEARIYDMMSCWYFANDKFDEALSVALMALPLCEKCDDETLLGDCINNIGIIYQRKGMFGQAITYMERVYRLDLKSKNKSGMSSTMNNLATLYLATGQAETALGYVLPAIDIERESGDRQRLAIRLGLASDIWLEMGYSEKALSCVEEAYQLDSQDKREGKAAIRLSQKAAVLIARGEDIEAEKCILQAIPILERKNNVTSLAICYNQLGQLYYKSELYKQAEKTYRQASEYALKSGSDYVRKKALSGLWLCQKHLGKLSDALETLEEYTQLSEKISEDRADSAVENFRVRYETKEKEDDLIREQEMSKTRFAIMMCLGVFCIMLAILLALSWRMLIIRRRQARILTKNDEVKSKLLSLVPTIKDKPEAAQLKEIVNDIETMDDVPKMTGRELEVIRLCCEGRTSKEIAGRLNVSVRTIDTHKSNIFKKLNISSTVELVRYAAKAGLYTPNVSGNEDTPDSSKQPNS